MQLMSTLVFLEKGKQKNEPFFPPSAIPTLDILYLEVATELLKANVPYSAKEEILIEGGYIKLELMYQEYMQRNLDYADFIQVSKTIGLLIYIIYDETISSFGEQQINEASIAIKEQLVDDIGINREKIDRWLNSTLGENRSNPELICDQFLSILDEELFHNQEKRGDMVEDQLSSMVEQAPSLSNNRLINAITSQQQDRSMLSDLIAYSSEHSMQELTSQMREQLIVEQPVLAPILDISPIDKIQECLGEHQVEVFDWTDKHEHTLVHWAAIVGHSDLIPWLENQDLLLSQENKYGLRPIHLAVIFNRELLCEELVDTDVDVNALECQLDYFSYSDLGKLHAGHIAIATGNIDL